MPKNAVYLWTEGYNGEKKSVFKNICIRVNGALRNTYSIKQTCIAINKNFSRFLSLYHKYWMKLILAQFFQWIEEKEVKVWGWDFILLAGMSVNTDKVLCTVLHTG